jgi:poly-gamma-glutamate synthesis protein (capsule biosynthesis protein)
LRKGKKKSIAPLITVLLVCVLCAGAAGLLMMSGVFGKGDDPFVASTTEPVSDESVEPEQEEPSGTAETTTMRLKAVGDNLIHDSIYRQAAEYAGGNGYDFAPMYQYVADVIADADLSYINQETIIAEKLYPLSGYPQFNTPEALGKYMVEIGFDVVSVANNHMLDMNEDGLLAALDFWEEQGVTVFGAWRNEEAMQEPILTETNGITIAWVPMTEHTNGLSLPADTSVRYIRTDEYDLMEQQIALARENADFVIVVPHWGTEYSLDANDNQEYLAQLFADWGVDLIIGSHSHTLQPVEWKEGKNGNRTLVVYSLGNFIGNMLYPQNMVGGILDIDITKDGATGETTITRAEVIPTVIHYEGIAKDIRIYLAEDYTDELAARHGMEQLDAIYDVTPTQKLTLSYIRSIIERNIPAEFRKN